MHLMVKCSDGLLFIRLEKRDLNARSIIMRRRIGRFKITLDLIDAHPYLVMTAMARCIIVRAESMYASNLIEYTAISPEFDVIPEGVVEPAYSIKVNTDEAGSYSIMFIRVK